MSFPRYERYKDSRVEWLADVPAHWEVKRLRFIADCLDGKRVPLNSEQRADKQGDVPYWGANSIVDYVDEALFDEPLVLLGEDGAPFQDPTKPVAFYSEGPVWPNNHVHVLRLHEFQVGKFVAYALNSTDYANFIDGSTRDKLTQSQMNNIALPWPAVEEQSIISAFLDRETTKIDALVAEQRRLIELLKEKRQGVISHAVTKGLNPDVPMKDSGIGWLGEVPEHWGVKRLRRVISAPLVNGIFKKKEEFGEGTLLVNVFDVYQNDFRIKFGSLDRVRCDTNEISSYQVLPGDLFFVRSSLKQEGIAVVAVAGDYLEAAVFECHLIRARPDRKLLDARYGSYLLNSAMYRFEMIAKAKITTMTTIDQEAILSALLPAPPVNEQKAIAIFLDRETAKLDKLTTETKRTITLLQERRTALISAAVTGKIDVRGLTVARPEEETVS